VGEKVRWTFGNEPSDENWFSVVRFGGHRMGPSPCLYPSEVSFKETTGSANYISFVMHRV